MTNLLNSTRELIEDVEPEQEFVVPMPANPKREWRILDTPANLENHLWHIGDTNSLTYFYRSYYQAFQMKYNESLRGRGNNFYAVKSGKSRTIHTGLPRAITDAKISIIFDSEWKLSDTSENKTIEEGQEVNNTAFEDLTKEVEMFDKHQNITKILKKVAAECSKHRWGFAVPVFDPEVSEEQIRWKVPDSRDMIIETQSDKIMAIRRVIKTTTSSKINGVFGTKTYYVHAIYECDKDENGIIRHEIFEDANYKKRTVMTVLGEKADRFKDFTFNGLSGMPIVVAQYEKDDYTQNISFYDTMDETLSTRMDEARRGKLMRFISKDLLEVDPETGQIKKFKDFDLDFMAIASGAGADGSKIETSKVDIDQEKYNNSLLADLAMVLPNVGLSATTLGRYLGGQEGQALNADREKLTIKTRNDLIKTVWTNTLYDFIVKTIKLSRFAAAYNGVKGEPYEATVIDEETGLAGTVKGLKANTELPDFGIEFENYDKPTDTEKQAAINALYAAGTASLDQTIRDLRPNWTEEQIDAEVQKIKDDKGISAMDLMNMGGGEDTDPFNKQNGDDDTTAEDDEEKPAKESKNDEKKTVVN